MPKGLLVLANKIYKVPDNVKDGWLGAFYSLSESDNVKVEIVIYLIHNDLYFPTQVPLAHPTDLHHEFL